MERLLQAQPTAVARCLCPDGCAEEPRDARLLVCAGRILGGGTEAGGVERLSAVANSLVWCCAEKCKSFGELWCMSSCAIHLAVAHAFFKRPGRIAPRCTVTSWCAPCFKGSAGPEGDTVGRGKTGLTLDEQHHEMGQSHQQSLWRQGPRIGVSE